MKCFLNEADGQAFDVDWGNHNTVIERNYSQQNRGGFLLLMPACNLRTEPTSLEPSSGTIVRYNITNNDSVTTGCARQPAHTGPAAVFHLVGDVPNRSSVPVSKPPIYNNTLVLSAAATAPLLGSRAGAHVKGSVIFANNIVVDRGTGENVATQGSTFSHNLFFGRRIDAFPEGDHTLQEDPAFTGSSPGSHGLSQSRRAFRLRASSPARRAGIVLEGTENEGTKQQTHPDLGAPAE